MDSILLEIIAMKRLVLDVCVSGLLAVCLIVMQNWNWQSPVRDFLASYNPIIWAIVMAVAFALITTFCWSNINQKQVFFSRILEILGMLLVIHIAAFTFYILRNTREDARVVLGFGLVFMFLPAVIASVGSFLFTTLIGWLIKR